MQSSKTTSIGFIETATKYYPIYRDSNDAEYFKISGQNFYSYIVKKLSIGGNVVDTFADTGNNYSQNIRPEPEMVRCIKVSCNSTELGIPNPQGEIVVSSDQSKLLSDYTHRESLYVTGLKNHLEELQNYRDKLNKAHKNQGCNKHLMTNW